MLAKEFFFGAADDGDGLGAGVAGGQNGEASEQIVGEVPEVFFVFGPGALVGFGDVDRQEPAELFGVGGVAAFFGRLTEQIEIALEEIDVEIRNAHVAPALGGDVLDGFFAAGAGNPDGRMRFL